jgi:hypothetical protein
MKEELAVSFGSVNRGVDDFDLGSANAGYAGSDAINGEAMRSGIADDSAFADIFAAGLKLRLDEDDGFERVLSFAAGADSLHDWRKHKGGRDERYVHGDEFDLRGQFAGSELAGVGALHEGDAGIAAEALGDLAVAGIDGENAGGSVLEHAIDEASGGGADVEAESAGEVDLPVTEGLFELEAPAAYVAKIFAEETQRGFFGDRAARFLDLLLIDEDTPGEDERLGAFAAGNQSAFDQ